MWDYDEEGSNILIDGVVDGQPRKIVSHAARNGFLDRDGQALCHNRELDEGHRNGRWHSPPRHRQLATLRPIPNDRRRVVRKYAGERRHVAGSVSHGARQLADRLLALRQRV
jgi:hypothetical protein